MSLFIGSEGEGAALVAFEYVYGEKSTRTVAQVLFSQ
jgi:hypothetical protein